MLPLQRIGFEAPVGVENEKGIGCESRTVPLLRTPKKVPRILKATDYDDWEGLGYRSKSEDLPCCLSLAFVG